MLSELLPPVASQPVIKNAFEYYFPYIEIITVVPIIVFIIIYFIIKLFSKKPLSPNTPFTEKLLGEDLSSPIGALR